MLESLREVTAQWDGQSPLDPSNQLRLQSLENELRDYLITKDPLRKLTPETIDNYLKSPEKTSTATLTQVIVIVLLSFFNAVSALILPVLGLVPWQNGFLLMVPLFFVTLHIGIAWLYFSALSNFKQEFKNAFVLICMGILLLSVVFSHYVIIELLGLGNLLLFRYGGILALVTASFGLIYFGLRKYAGLLKINNFFTSLKWLGLVSVAVIAAAVLAPHPGQQSFEPFFDFALASMWLFTMFVGFSAGVARQISKNVTIAYAKSMKWLYIYLILGFVGSFGGTIGLPLVGELNGGFLYVLIGVMGVIPQLFLLYTGYLFKKETSLT